MYEIVLNKKVQKFLTAHKGEKLINIFQEHLKILSKYPIDNNLDIKPMKGSDEQFRLRIGKYRFIYEIDNNIITITFIDAGSRGKIYK